MWGLADAARTRVAKTTGVQHSSVHLLLSAAELEARPFFTGLDYSLVADVLPHSEYTCFADLFVGSNLFSLFTAGQNLDRGGLRKLRRTDRQALFCRLASVGATRSEA